MTISISDKAINQKLSKNDIRLWTDYQNTPIKDRDFDKFKQSIAGCSDEVQELFIRAEEAGVALEFNDDGTLNKKTIASLNAVNQKYKEGSLAAKAYTKSIEAKQKADAIGVGATKADTVATDQNTLANKENAASSLAAAEAENVDTVATNSNAAATTADTVATVGNTSRNYNIGPNGENRRFLGSNNNSTFKKNGTKPTLDEYKKRTAAIKQETSTVQQNVTAQKTAVKTTQQLTIKQEAHTAALHAKAGAYKVAAAGANLFSLALLKDLVTMGLVSVGISALSWGLKKLWEMVPTKSHLKEWAEEASTALQETRDEIESTKSELESIGERIDELQAKGSLSLTEKDELRNLQAENAELERRKKILEKVEVEQNRESSKKNLEVLRGYTNDTINEASTLTSSGTQLDVGTIGKQIDNYTRMYNAAQKELSEIDTDGMSAKESQALWDEKNEQIETYRSKLTELLDVANEYTSGIDKTLLSDADLKLYEETVSAINKSLYETGDMDVDSYLATLFDSEDEFDDVKADMRELAASSEEINKNTIKEFIDSDSIKTLNEAGLTLGEIEEHIQSLRGVEGEVANIIDKISSSDEEYAEKISTNIEAIVNNENFDAFDEDSMKRIFGTDFIKQLKEAGYSVDDLIAYLKEAQQEANNIDFSDALSELTGIGDAIESLNDAYEQFAEDGYVDNDKLSKVAEQFASINDSDAYKEFIQTISNSESTIDQVDTAMENLVNTYMTSNEVMSNLTEKNRELYESRLKSMGVANSSEIVEYNLQKAILGSTSATEKAKIEAADAMAALMQEEWALNAVGVAALDSATKMQLFAAYEQFAAGNNFADVVSNHATALANVANAAGPAAAKLKEYVQIVALISQIQEALLDPSQKSGWSYMRNSLPALYDRLDDLADGAQEEFINLSTPDIEFTPGSTVDIDSPSGSSDKDSPSEKRKSKYDKEKAKLDYQLDQNLISYTTYYNRLEKLGEKYLKNKEGNEEDYQDHLMELSDVREDAYNKRVAELEKQYENGEITRVQYYNRLIAAGEKWLKDEAGNEEAYQDHLEEASDKRKELYEDRKAELEKQYENGEITRVQYYNRLRSALEYWLKDQEGLEDEYDEGQKDLTDTRVKMYEDRKDELDRQLELGLISHAQYYSKLKSAGEYWLKDQEGLEEEYQDFLIDSNKSREDAYDERKKILDKKLEDGKISFTAYYKSITSAMDKWLSDSDANSEKYAEEQKSLAEQCMTYWEDRINKTQEKINHLDLTKTWKPGVNEKYYWNELLDDIQDAYAKGILTMTQYTELYWQIMENLNNAEKDYYENQKNHIDELIDMVSQMLKQEAEDMIEALEKQKEKYSEIVDAKKEALQLTRDQLEYENELNDANEDLAELQALASIYANDTTLEGQAKLAQIMEQIAEKEREIAEKQSDHAFDATNDALDAANEAFQESIQDKIDKINEEMENQGKWLEKIYAYIDKTSTNNLYKQLLDWNYQYGDGKNSTVENLWKEIKPLIQKYDISDLIKMLSGKTSSSDDPTPSDNYKTKDEVIKAAQASKTRKNTDQENLDMTSDIKRYFSNAVYDADTNVWYTSSSKLRTVSASPIISEIESIAKNTKLGKASRRRLIEPLLKKLRTYWGYPNAHMDYDNMHLYKTSGTKKKIFHSGLAGGFVGDDYTPSQKESYALLSNDELVLNKKDQFRLANQIQVLDTVKKAFDGLFASASVGDYVGSGVNAININVEAPVVVNGNADDDTVNKLTKFSRQIANETLNRLESAMGQRGYSSRVAQNALKKL